MIERERVPLGDADADAADASYLAECQARDEALDLERRIDLAVASLPPSTMLEPVEEPPELVQMRADLAARWSTVHGAIAAREGILFAACGGNPDGTAGHGYEIATGSVVAYDKE